MSHFWGAVGLVPTWLNTSLINACGSTDRRTRLRDDYCDAGQRKRLAKAGKRLQKLRSLKVPVTRKKVRVYSASIVAAGIWGHQSQGISPKVQKTLRMQAGNMVHLQKLGSVDIALDLQESNIKDPAVEIVVQHWKTVSKVSLKGMMPNGYAEHGRSYGPGSGIGIGGSG